MSARPLQGLALLADGLPGLAAPLCVAELSAAHPLWRADAESLGPWREDHDALAPHRLARPDDTSAAVDILVCGDCGSSLDVALALAAEERLAPWGSVLALTQSKGRGQLRRHWHSPPGNILAALICPAAGLGWNELWSLVLGYLLAGAFLDEKLRLELKWPNDLLLGGQKVGGILVEERQGVVLAGVGLNLAWAPPEELLRADHALPAGTLLGAGIDAGPLRLWARLVKRMEKGYKTLLETSSPAEFPSLLLSRLAWVGRRVLVRERPDAPFEAIVTGLTERGELVLSREGREVTLLSGDIRPL